MLALAKAIAPVLEVFYCVYRYHYYRTSGQIVEGWHPAPRYAGPPGEALPAFGAGWAGQEGLTALPAHLCRRYLFGHDATPSTPYFRINVDYLEHQYEAIN